MKSSAMRDLMAITERARGHLARRRAARHLDVPAETRTPRSCAASPPSAAPARCSTGRPRAWPCVKGCIVEVMAAEGMRVDADDLLVTTGGQQVIDLVCKTLIDPGDVIVAEAPDLPGRGADLLRLPGRRRADRDGRRRHARRRARGDARPPRAPRAGAPKFIYTMPELPEPGRRDDVAAAPAAAGARSPASASCSCSRTTRTGCCATRASRCRRCTSLDGGEFVIYLGTFSKILSPGIRLGWAVAPRPVLEKMNLGKQAADLCSSSMTQHFVAAYFEQRPLAGLRARR